MSNMSNIGQSFIITSLMIGIGFCLLFPIFIKKTDYGLIVATFLVGHLLLTFATYVLSLREDIRSTKESGFSRIKKTIVLFVAAPSGLILIALLNLVDLHGSLRAAYFLLILSAMTLSFNAITLSALISIITWRTRVHVKIWRKDIIVILISVLFLFCISFLAYFIAFALSMA